MMAMSRGFMLFAFATLCPFSVAAAETHADRYVLESPDGGLRVAFHLDEKSGPTFGVTYYDTPVVDGTLGLEFAGSGALSQNLEIVDVRRNSYDEAYTVAVGKTSSARDRHHEMVVALQEAVEPRRRLEIAFRAFDDGAAFRYLIPSQEPLVEFVLLDEQTRLTFADHSLARILPLKGYTTPYEAYYQRLPISAITPDKLLGVPMLVEQPRDELDPIWLAVSEASLTDYAGMYFSSVVGHAGMLSTKLAPLPGRNDGAKVLGNAPHASPWRVLMIADRIAQLIESDIIFHLSDPPAVEDTSWIKTGKTTFPWWNAYVLPGVDFEPGVNTATMKYYIDFCAEHGIEYHSLDGLDIAWYGGPIRPDGPTDVTTAAESIDLPEVLRYAQEKGVRLRLWMHWEALKPQIDEAFAIYQQWGIEGVMVDFMDRDDQEMVRFYHEMAAKAAKHQLTLTLHGAYKPTGMERTWPNVLSYEAVLNQEYNKWEPPGVKGTPPEHNLDVAFIRTLAGPLDYHQGGMRSVLPENYRYRDKAPPVQGTRGHQLAMYVVYQNHLPMLADYPDAYRGQPGFNFLLQVPTNWDQTRVLHTEIDQCIVVARRKGDVWYLGGMTATEARDLSLPLHFLGDGGFEVELYLDDPSGGPNHLTLSNATLSTSEALQVQMPAAGGFAARLQPVVQPNERRD
jgi:alpha-glucosidase